MHAILLIVGQYQFQNQPNHPRNHHNRQVVGGVWYVV
jgi:hypothetical protein